MSVIGLTAWFRYDLVSIRLLLLNPSHYIQNLLNRRYVGKLNDPTLPTLEGGLASREIASSYLLAMTVRRSRRAPRTPLLGGAGGGYFVNRFAKRTFLRLLESPERSEHFLACLSRCDADRSILENRPTFRKKSQRLSTHFFKNIPMMYSFPSHLIVDFSFFRFHC